MSDRMRSRIRWWLWGKLANRESVCPANAYTRVISGVRDQAVKVDQMCRRDLAANRSCYCGKLRRP